MKTSVHSRQKLLVLRSLAVSGARISVEFIPQSVIEYSLECLEKALRLAAEGV